MIRLEEQEKRQTQTKEKAKKKSWSHEKTNLTVRTEQRPRKGHREKKKNYKSENNPLVKGAVYTKEKKKSRKLDGSVEFRKCCRRSGGTAKKKREKKRLRITSEPYLGQFSRSESIALKPRGKKKKNSSFLKIKIFAQYKTYGKRY